MTAQPSLPGAPPPVTGTTGGSGTVKPGTIWPVGLTNDELTRRYQDGEALDTLAQAAEMTLSGVQARLRRLGVGPRREGRPPPTEAQVRAAVDQHKSINAAAAALGVHRNWLAAEAQRLGLRHSFDTPADLLQRADDGASLAQLAEHYNSSTTTVAAWLHALGRPRPPRGRRPRDG